MRTIRYFAPILILSVFLSSCSDTEDSTLFLAKDHMINSEGYLPLAPNNHWVYKSYEATENTDGSISYDDATDFTEQESFIVKANVLSTKKANGESVNFISYEFSPLASNGILGGILGNFNQVVKDFETGEYYKTELEKIKFVKNSRGDIETKFISRLSDDAFLFDTITDADIGKELFYERKTIDVEFGIPFKLVYERSTKITGKFDKIPTFLANTEGVDTNLQNYSDIVKITDYLRVVEVSASVKTVNLTLDLDVVLKPDQSTAFLNSASSAGSTAPVTLNLLTDLFDIPIFGIPINLIPLWVDQYSFENLTIRIMDFEQQLRLCESRIDYKVQSNFDVPIQINFSNDIPYIQDTYYAKNVGMIKRVTFNKPLTGETVINPNLAALDLGNIQLLPTDPNCVENSSSISIPAIGTPVVSGSNVAQISLEIEPQINSFKSSTPFINGEPSVRVTNISAHDIR